MIKPKNNPRSSGRGIDTSTIEERVSKIEEVDQISAERREKLKQLRSIEIQTALQRPDEIMGAVFGLFEAIDDYTITGTELEVIGDLFAQLENAYDTVFKVNKKGKVNKKLKLIESKFPGFAALMESIHTDRYNKLKDGLDKEQLNRNNTTWIDDIDDCTSRKEQYNKLVEVYPELMTFVSSYDSYYNSLDENDEDMKYLSTFANASDKEIKQYNEIMQYAEKLGLRRYAYMGGGLLLLIIILYMIFGGSSDNQGTIDQSQSSTPDTELQGQGYRVFDFNEDTDQYIGKIDPRDYRLLTQKIATGVKEGMFADSELALAVQFLEKIIKYDTDENGTIDENESDELKSKVTDILKEYPGLKNLKSSDNIIVLPQ